MAGLTAFAGGPGGPISAQMNRPASTPRQPDADSLLREKQKREYEEAQMRDQVARIEREE